jgi:hypothetical protein
VVEFGAGRKIRCPVGSIAGKRRGAQPHVAIAQSVIASMLTTPLPVLIICRPSRARLPVATIPDET